MSEQTAIGGIDAAPGERAARGGQPHFSAGDALIQPSLNRISIHGRVTQVEPKVMQVLVLMAERPGAVVPRARFLDTVWADTLGDDYLLNRAVSELRRIFEDDPKAPRYIETIRKTGYRLIAPIAPARIAAAVAETPPEAPAAEPTGQPLDDGRRSAARPVAEPPTPARARPWRAVHGWTLALAGVALAAAIALAIALTITLRPPADGTAISAGYTVQPLTSFVGRELEPALSPDGSRVAFLWDGGEGGFDVYVKTVGSEDVLNLTRSAEDERHPLWTADGRALLFARTSESGTAIMRVSALGGGTTRVFVDPAITEVRGMSLSPDGTRIVYAGRRHPAEPYRLFAATPDSGERTVLSHPEPASLGDTDPRFAPDGRTLAFVRARNEVTKDVHTVAPAGGEPRRLTFDSRKINGLAWSPDGERLLFTSTRSGTYGLWSMAPGGGDLRQEPLGGENVQQPATASGLGAIAFEQWMHRSQLRRIDAATGEEHDGGAFVRSTRWDSNPVWSPDGARIAFSSNRSGPHGIWVSDADGRAAVQIADFDGAFIDNPAWSPDGRWLAFDGSPEGRTAVYTVPAEGGVPRSGVAGPGDHRNAAWSRDGAWLYFESNRSGEWRVYAQPATGGEAVAVTAGAAVNPRESTDGRHLLYTRPDVPGLWRRPREDWHARTASRTGGEPGRLLIAELDPRDAGNWAPAADGVYFVRRPAEGAPVLSRFRYADASITDLATLSPGFEGWGLDLSPDGDRVILAELMIRESDLRLAMPR